MKLLAVAIASLCMIGSSAHAQGTNIQENVGMVVAALDKYRQDTLFAQVWQRPGLSARDRSVVTLAALIARNQTVEMPFYFNLALDNALKPKAMGTTSKIVISDEVLRFLPSSRSY